MKSKRFPIRLQEQFVLSPPSEAGEKNKKKVIAFEQHTPFVRQYGITLTSGGGFMTKGKPNKKCTRDFK